MICTRGLLTAFASVALAASPAAAAGLILDPIQPIFDPAAPTLAIGGSSEQRLAQTLTIGRKRVLPGIFVPDESASGQLILELRSVEAGEPGGTVLRRRRFRAEDLDPVVSSFLLLRLPRLAVAVGDTLAVVLRSPSGACGVFAGPMGDPYPGGGGFFDARPNPPGWIPLELGSGRQDLAFQALVQVP